MGSGFSGFSTALTDTARLHVVRSFFSGNFRSSHHFHRFLRCVNVTVLLTKLQYPPIGHNEANDFQAQSDDNPGGSKVDNFLNSVEYLLICFFEVCVVIFEIVQSVDN